VIYYNTK